MPRCRTMIEPAGTSWPSPTLTPSRWPTLSRPFFELEPAFLCAMDQASFFVERERRAGAFSGVLSVVILLLVFVSALAAGLAEVLLADLSAVAFPAGLSAIFASALA